MTMGWLASLFPILGHRPTPLSTPRDEEADALGEAIRRQAEVNEREALAVVAAGQRLDTANSRVQAFVAGMLAEIGRGRESRAP